MESKFGIYGGQFVSELLMKPLKALESKFIELKNDELFIADYQDLLKNYIGRETPLYYAKNLSQYCKGPKIYLKREDLNHTGAHKINNAIGQALIAKRMNKKRIIAETGAGQHGVATATACALLGLECTVYMGALDAERQITNVEKMKLLGAQVEVVDKGSRVLKDATNEAIRQWVNHIDTTHYIIGSAIGPHPYPQIVKHFQQVIGQETYKQFFDINQQLPTHVIACIGGGSNAIGMFTPFIKSETQLIGVEAAGQGIDTPYHAATLTKGSVGALHGSMMYLLQDENGNVKEAHSISAGLDYPGVGPEHCYLKDMNLVTYKSITDTEAVEAFKLLSTLEGIIPALESSHAIAQCIKEAQSLTESDSIVVCLSGRGDKDMTTILRMEAKDEII